MWIYVCYVYIYMVVHIFVCFEHHLGPKLKRYPGGLESLIFFRKTTFGNLWKLRTGTSKFDFEIHPFSGFHSHPSLDAGFAQKSRQWLVEFCVEVLRRFRREVLGVSMKPFHDGGDVELSLPTRPCNNPCTYIHIWNAYSLPKWCWIMKKG